MGDELPEYEVPIEEGKIGEFALAAQSKLADYRGPDAITPPTFLITAAATVPDECRAQHGFDRKRLLHGEQEFIFHGPPPRAGQRLRARERVAERYEKPGSRGGTMRFAVIVTDFRDEHGNLVAEARRTLIERAAKTEAKS